MSLTAKKANQIFENPSNFRSWEKEGGVAGGPSSHDHHFLKIKF